jgi:quercetin dioxygenase-like cupin family protein
MRFAALAVFVLLGLALGSRARTQGQKPGQEPETPTIPGAVFVTQEPHHHLLYANSDMRVFDVIVPPHQSTLLHEHDHDYIFVTFGQSTLTVMRPGMPPASLELPSGAVRFSKAVFAHAITNDGDYPFHNMTIEFLNPVITGRGCSCNGGPGDAVCDCPNAPLLPANWSKQIGRLHLRGIMLAPGATFEDSSQFPTRLLVPVTPLDVIDTSTHSPKHVPLRLPVGRFHWLSPGPHEIQNVSAQALRMVSISF